MTKPEGLSERGGRLWEGVTAVHDLDVAQLAVLLEACRVADRQDQLHERVKVDGVVSPAARAEWLGAMELARLIAALRLPDERGRRARRRSIRGVHAAPVSSLERRTAVSQGST